MTWAIYNQVAASFDMVWFEDCLCFLCSVKHQIICFYSLEPACFGCEKPANLSLPGDVIQVADHQITETMARISQPES